MRTWISLLILISIASIGAANAQDQTSLQQRRVEPAHLVLDMSQGGVAQVNRMEWDVNAFSTLTLGAGVRSNDYIEVSGDTILLILCADLEVIEQRGNQVPPCNQYINNPVFFYAGQPTWQSPDLSSGIIVFPPDLASQEVIIVDPEQFSQTELGGDTLAQVIDARDTIMDLGLSDEAEAFALASLYRGQGLLIDALNILLDENVGLECTARRPFVEPPGRDARQLVKSPVVYLRVGELFQMLDQSADAARYYNCAAELAGAVGDTANQALAFTRLGNVSDNASQKIDFYQQAITLYAGLNAPDIVDAVLEICGRGNCAVP